MKRAYIAGLAAIMMVSAMPAGAESMDGKSLREAVSGKVVYLRLAFGVDLPIRYRPNGTMRGAVKAFAAAMAGSEPKSDSGRWWIANDQLCQRWNRWMDSRSYCYRLSREGATVTWLRNDGRRGTARLGG